MTDLAALVAMRLAHDLAGPLGAVATGIELLEDGDTEIRALIADGATAAITSLRLHRFILAPPSDATTGHSLLAGWIKTRPGVMLDWHVKATDPAHVAILLGLAMTAGEAAPDGGTVTVDDGGVTLATAKLRLDPSIAAAFAGVPVDIARAALAGIIYARTGLVTVTVTPDGLRLDYQGKALPR
jgi:hypothetical protein